MVKHLWITLKEEMIKIKEFTSIFLIISGIFFWILIILWKMGGVI